MIETRIYYTIPATVFQRVTGEIDLEEIKRGTAEANEIIQSVIKKYGSFNLIVDARGIRFADLAAHRTWKQTGENYPDIMERMNYFVFVLDDSSNARAEKEFMETETQRFFFDISEGINWLKEMARNKV